MTTDAAPISRRAFLATGTVLAATTPGAATLAQGSGQKISKADAKYQDHPNYNGQQRCEICLQFDPPSQCKIVQGPISPQGWCQYFAAKENAH